jgi:hypothetical protein
MMKESRETEIHFSISDFQYLPSERPPHRQRWLPTNQPAAPAPGP